MRASVFILTFLFLSLSQASDFSGVWRGEGTYFTSASGEFPADAEVRIIQDQLGISTRDCWSFTDKGKPHYLCTDYHFDFDGNDVFYEGLKVGTLSDQKIEVRLAKDDKRIEASLEMQPGRKVLFRYALRSRERVTRAAALLSAASE